MVKLGSPVLGLGVFFIFCLALPVFGEEAAGYPAAPLPGKSAAAEYRVSAQGGSLWTDGEHASGFWGTGFSLNSGPLYGAIAAGGVFSDLPGLDADYTGLGFNAGLNTAPLGFDLLGGLFHRDALNAQGLGVQVTSDGADGYFLRLALPVRFGSWDAEPSVLFAQGFWEDGDLYWFFGKPRVPAFFAAGLSAGFREEHRIYFHYFSLDLNMLNPSDENLFTSHFDSITAAYHWNFSRKPFRLAAAPGWLFAAGGLDGSLTSLNQPYYLFPYLFYDAALNARIHALFGALEAEYRRDIFRLNMTLGAAHILWGELNADLHSKQKTLSYLGIPIFDGREESYSRSLNPAGLGAAFLLIEGGIEGLPLSRKETPPRLSLTAKKLFALPWGYEDIIADGSSGSGQEGETPSSFSRGTLNLISILLSGLSLSCSISW
ncbi:hypothetical protein Holit_00943 [Hollandina sp. SP2]